MAKITFVFGGARSGKSAFAEEIAKKYNHVIYIATAEIKDDEMRERIKSHRARRPPSWKTIESPYNLDKTVSNIEKEGSLLLIDCITLYVSNILLKTEVLSNNQFVNMNGEVVTGKQAQILAEIKKLSKACRKSPADAIIISNEVGFGIVPDNAVSRMYRDIMGCANQILADEADEVFFVIAGIVQRVK